MENYGKYDSVEAESYCMPSWQKRNVDQMTDAMGYHDMSDLANTSQPPTKPTGVKANVQLGPKPANPRHNDRS